VLRSQILTLRVLESAVCVAAAYAVSGGERYAALGLDRISA
jgi:hypothetical protein